MVFAIVLPVSNTRHFCSSLCRKMLRNFQFTNSGILANKSGVCGDFQDKHSNFNTEFIDNEWWNS